MHRTALKDARYQIIGYIDTAPNGKQIARDPQYHVLGHYDPASNLTKDARYHVVGRGNLLSALIGCH